MWNEGAFNLIIGCTCIIILQFCDNVLTFNLNVDLAKIFTGNQSDTQSLFGYTVDFLRTKETPPKNWILVGAPKSYDKYQPSLKEPGALFKCDPDASNCEQIKVAKGGNVQDNDTYTTEIVHGKNHAWLGASLSIGDAVMVCSPRWQDNIESKRNQDPLTHMSGLCYEIPSALEVEYIAKFAFLSEKVKDKWTQSFPSNFSETGIYYHYMHGQLGMSVRHLDQASSEMVIGAPGLRDGNGGTIYLASNSDPSITSEPFTADRNHDYFGYSVMPGKYLGNGETLFAVGGPRGDGVGQVKILRKSGTEVGDISGEETGSYFGSVLCAVDVDMNNKDILVVGAPFFGNLTVVNFDSYHINQDEGKVYVYSYDSSTGFQNVQQLRGSNSKNSRFGSALSSPGDINRDGALDLAVGAPYEDDGKGSVYIYNGYKGMFWHRATQIIKASSINPGLMGFGMYLSQYKLSVDDNDYNDLVIGAPNSNRVVMLKSNPTIGLEVSVKNSVNVIKNDTNEFNIQVCFKYTGDKSSPPDITVNYSVEIDYNRTILDKRERVVYILDRENSVRGKEKKVIKGYSNVQCSENFTMLVQTRQDIVSPVTFMVRYAIKHKSDTGKDCSLEPCPIISVFDAKRQVPDANFLQAKIDFKKPGCGQDNMCDTNLKLTATPKFNYESDALIRGPGAGFQLDVKVQNNEEAAYAVDLRVYGPNYISYWKVVPASGSQSDVTCSPRNNEEDTISYLECGLSNSEVPFAAGRTDMFTIYFVAPQTPVVETMKIDLNLETRSNELNMTDNKYSITKPVHSKAEIVFAGVGNPELYVTSKTKTDSIVHLFDFNNKGPSILDSPTKFTVKYPSVVINSKALLKAANMTFTVPTDVSTFDCGPEYSKEIVVLQRGTSGVDSKITYRITEKNPSNSDNTLYNCESQECKKVECNIYPLNVNSIVTVRISFKMDPNILASVKGQESSIESLPILSVATTSLPDNIRLVSDHSYSATAKTDVVPAEQKEGKVAWWVYFLGVLGALLVLAIIVLILWKCGFFKRKDLEELKKQKEQGDGGPTNDGEQLLRNGQKEKAEETKADGKKQDVSGGFDELDKMLKEVQNYS